jgi:hypothetical protein
VYNNIKLPNGNKRRKKIMKDFYFEVKNEYGKVVATFITRWEAEKFAESKKRKHTVTKIEV